MHSRLLATYWERSQLSLRQVYRDVILFFLFLGSIFTCVVTFYFYVVSREPFYVMMAFASGIAFILIGVSRFVFMVEFWRTIMKYWRKKEESQKLQRRPL